ncbi:hypothetical protein [Nesterenkonia pannonica]|uniref:hypothetical protein n=1 Tax=Nesterenkonia pannonica TaxID=1548602 RepID=UPI002164CA5C|nr:hypothetical protein [Nesterenkonia pannonica]
MQILRMLRSVGALRVLRAKQVAKVSESLQKSGGSAWKRYLGSALAIIVVGAFVIAALADPESPARDFLEGLFGEEGAIAASIGAGVVIMGLMFLLVRPDKSSQNE